MGLSITKAPRLIWRGIASGNMGLLALALDIAVPPLTLLGYLNVLALLLTSLAFLFGVAPLGLYLSAISLGAFLLALLLAWTSHGRDVLPAHSGLLVGSYIFAKVRLYVRLLSRGPVSQWIRTDRQ